MNTTTQRYNDYGNNMRCRLGGRVQKLAIDAHMGCPNRNGTIGYGGCTFCLNEAFSPSYCRAHESITLQIDNALLFHASRHRNADIYLAYFQSGTNTNAPIEQLKKIYSEALLHPAISGIIVGTRPDCINSEILDILEDISHTKYVAIEYGIESTDDTTLQHINRGHTFAAAELAVRLTHERKIDVGAHLILGLPNERRADILESVKRINALPLNFIKFHQLQIYRDTAMADEWVTHPERFALAQSMTAESYADLIVDILRRLRPDIAVERFVSMAPRHLILHSALGGIRPDALRSMVIQRLATLNAVQGDLKE